MRNLLAFLQKYNYWFLFVVLEVTSFLLLINFNRYQGSAYLTSANALSGTVYGATSGVGQYFGLRRENEELAERNIHLEQELTALRNAYLQATSDTAWVDALSNSVLKRYTMRHAEVVNGTTKRTNNYLTLNRGEADGVRRDMGVIDGKGVVGIVYLTSAHYSLVIPIINAKSSLSCKIMGSSYVGDLMWSGGDCQYV